MIDLQSRQSTVDSRQSTVRRTVHWTGERAILLRVTIALALALLGAGCEDIRRFEGLWVGQVSADPAHQQGFGADAFLRATVTSASRTSIAMSIDLPQQSGPLAFAPIRHAADDALGDLRLDGEPLRTFLGYLQPPMGAPYLAVVSLFAEDRIDVRLIRGPDEAYGVFSLRRTRDVRP
jgi:hypothetical protein